MSSSSKQRQTMAKMTRERAVKEKRALKQEKKDERKAAAARDAELAANPGAFGFEEVPDGEEPPDSTA